VNAAARGKEDKEGRGEREREKEREANSGVERSLRLTITRGIDRWPLRTHARVAGEKSYQHVDNNAGCDNAEIARARGNGTTAG